MAQLKKPKHRKDNKPWEKGEMPRTSGGKRTDSRPHPAAAAPGRDKTVSRPRPPAVSNRDKTGSPSRPYPLPRPAAEAKPEATGYAELVWEACRAFPKKFLFDVRSVDPLADLAYADECLIKQQALEVFWKKHQIPGVPGKIMPSPMPRGYRTNSKRRVLIYKGKVSLVMEQHHCEPGTLQRSSLEPDMHLSIYQLLLELLSGVNYQSLARSLNFCIIRGSYTRCSIILNVFAVDNIIVRKIKQFAATLKASDPRILSCFMYVDPTRSDYYLESKRPEKGVAIKKLFGPESLDVTVDGIRLLYPPTVFSQINESMLPNFTGAVRDLLELSSGVRLLDLYCGYGMLGLVSAPHVGSVIGMDIEGPAIHAAIENAKYHFPGKQLKFIASPITADSLCDKLPPPHPKEVVLLDPPRSGTARGVIHAIAERQPCRVLHIFCGTDEIPRELLEWKAGGYVPERILPLDMFPGSPNLETMILLKPCK